ncbi:MAG: gamma-glutamylcyclotransferase family protein [Planctomycetaceae bacterium]
MPQQLSQLVFVYGSLKRGYALHTMLQGQLCLGNAVTEPLYRLFDLGSYPGLVEWPEGLAIRGEVYQVGFDCLSRLDEAEGVAERLYVRRKISLQAEFRGKDVQAWFWLNAVRDLKDCGAAWP